ncbi:unannotated protein [freshwater metagenome]|uniref:Unannotated protein n=1 Tax=freshwater metagenome TaxID=449393 RepID=A0A6J7D7E1_9ZZZZ
MSGIFCARKRKLNSSSEILGSVPFSPFTAILGVPDASLKTNKLVGKIPVTKIPLLGLPKPNLFFTSTSSTSISNSSGNLTIFFFGVLPTDSPVSSVTNVGSLDPLFSLVFTVAEPQLG